MAVGDKATINEMGIRVAELRADFAEYQKINIGKDHDFTDSEAVNAFVRWTICCLAELQLHVQAIEKMLLKH